MDMESLLSTILNNLNSGLPVENRIPAALKLTDIINQGLELQAGKQVQISLNQNSGQLTLLSDDGKTLNLPSSSLQIKSGFPAPSEPVVLAAKVVSVRDGVVNLQLTEVNNRPLPQYLREQAVVTENTVVSPQPLIIRESSELRQIPLPELKLQEAAEPYISRLPLPETAKNEIRNALAQVGLKVSITNLQPVATGTEVAEPEVSAAVTKIMSQIALAVNNAVTPEQSLPAVKIAETLAQNLQTLVKETGGNILPALTAAAPRRETVFVSALGILKPEIPLQLPENLPAELEITDIVLHQPQPETKRVSPADNLLKIIKTLQTENPRLFKMIETKLPADNENMLGNLAAFGKAAAKGDVRQWLGTEIVRELENSGNSGRTVLNELQNVLQESSRQTPSWRIVEIPFYAENRMDKIKLAVKQYPEDDDETDDARQKFGTRFVVDTDFTRLGAFQFDGFSFAKDRRFDLIIRTERDIGRDLCANIMRIFKNTLNDVAYSGNIKVNLKENFIKISEDSNQNKVLSRDLFI